LLVEKDFPHLPPESADGEDPSATAAKSGTKGFVVASTPTWPNRYRARSFLEGCPEKVRAMMLAVVKAVADAPPPQFVGGGKWEDMHGDMAGYFEVRVDGPNRRHSRLFASSSATARPSALAEPAWC
jgi:Txe/YoeB family toxin of Txe-Axe toxin-antitoxin module